MRYINLLTYLQYMKDELQPVGITGTGSLI